MIQSVDELRELARDLNTKFPNCRIIHVFVESTEEEQKQISNTLDKDYKESSPFILEGVDMSNDPLFSAYSYLNVRFAFNKKKKV